MISSKLFWRCEKRVVRVGDVITTSAPVCENFQLSLPSTSKIALLNSKLVSFWLKYKGKMQGDIFQVDKEPLLNLPILKIDEESQKPFIKLVDEILEAKQKIKDYKPLLDEAIKNNNFDREIALKKELENLENICTTNEKTIDQMVYKLYDLTPDEIKIVEGV